MQLNPCNNEYFFFGQLSIFVRNIYCVRNKGQRGAQITTFMRGVKPGMKGEIGILAETGYQLRGMRTAMCHCL